MELLVAGLVCLMPRKHVTGQIPADTRILRGRSTVPQMRSRLVVSGAYAIRPHFAGNSILLAILSFRSQYLQITFQRNCIAERPRHFVGQCNLTAHQFSVYESGAAKKEQPSTAYVFNRGIYRRGVIYSKQSDTPIHTEPGPAATVGGGFFQAGLSYI
jgi:hypothetical protein